jgi:pimeloyl-ACP methyl ester carboxylesterase
MQPQSRYVKANGINHHYLDWGNPESPPLLMLHATGLCAHAWKPVARELAPHFHVMAFDQRGHGDTDPSDRGYTFHLVGEDLAAIVQAMNLSQFYIVGHSSGGLSALIADSLLPGRIDRVVLVETRVGIRPASAPAQELQVRAQRTRMKRAVWESRQTMYDAYRSRPVFKDWQEEAFRAFIEGGTRLWDDGRAELKCSPEVEAIFYERRDSLDVTQYLPGLQGQYLLLLGDYPGCQTLEDTGVRQFLALVKKSRVKPMGRGSHFLPMEYPELVLQEIRAFFSLSTE